MKPTNPGTPVFSHGRVARSTLADVNDAHDWRIYADFAQVLIRIARPLHASDPKLVRGIGIRRFQVQRQDWDARSRSAT